MDMKTEPLRLYRDGTVWKGAFDAMANPCEVLMDGCDELHARKWLKIIAHEAWRIEKKYSRYRANSELSRINASNGNLVHIDEETSRLLAACELMFQISEGKFDATSGVLRKVWHFGDGPETPLPDKKSVDAVRPFIGWDKIQWSKTAVQVPNGMELDFGGIGKEYAVDRAAMLIGLVGAKNVLINFGGDILALGARADGSPWQVGVETVAEDGSVGAGKVVLLSEGGMATSGNVRRYLEVDGERYGHILNPATGWPVRHAPRSVTVAAATCSEAGMLSTLAMLNGKNAETCLADQCDQFWVQW